MNDLYETDFYAWTQEQAAVLRKRRVADNRIDRDRLAEEVQDLGASELRAVTSFCRLILLHLLKIEFSGLAEPQRHWRHEVRNARVALDRRVTPTIRAELEGDLERQYRLAQRLLADLEEDVPGLLARLPADCPYPLDKILGEGAHADWYPTPTAAQSKRRRPSAGGARRPR